MAITTYAQLQAAAANWLVRADLTARVPEFIALAEARLNRVLRHRLAEVEASLTATASSRFISLPADYSEPKALWFVIDGQRRRKQFCEPSLMNASDSASQPDYWGVDGDDIAFERPCDQAYSVVLRYLSKYVLSDAAPTNALLTEAPDVYLFATLAEAGPFLRDADLSSAYEAKLTRAIGEFNAKSRRSKAQQPMGTEISRLALNSRHGFDITVGE